MKVAPLLLLLTIATSASLSPWWNPWTSSLSALGSSSNGLGGAVFNGGLALTSLNLFEDKDVMIKLVGVFLALVSAINIDFGLAHLAVATLLFLLLHAYLLLKDPVLAAASAAFWALHFVAGLPPGIALPELFTALLASYAYSR